MSLRPLLLLLPLLLVPGCQRPVPPMPPPAPPRAAPPAPFDATQKGRVLQEIGQVLRTRAAAPGQDFTDWEARCQSAQESLQAAASPEHFATALNAVLQGYGLSHLRVVRDQPRPGHQGPVPLYGFFTRPDGEGQRVTQVVAGSAAQRAGLRGGDQIMAPAGPFAAQGPPLTLQGQRQGQPMTWAVACEPVTWPERPSLAWLDPATAVLRVPSLEGGAYHPDTVAELIGQARKAEALILDLRGNAGGMFHATRHLATLLMPGKNRVLAWELPASVDPQVRGLPLAERARRQGQPLDLLGLSQRGRFGGKLVVVVDSGTMSAAETLAAALQAHGRARLAGTRTAGAVLRIPGDGQDRYGCRLSAGLRLIYPDAILLSPTFQPLEGQGLQPDLPLAPSDTLTDAHLFPRLLADLRRS